MTWKNKYEQMVNTLLLPKLSEILSLIKEQYGEIIYRDAGVISESCSFEDDKWQTTDECSNVGLRFSVSHS